MSGKPVLRNFVLGPGVAHLQAKLADWATERPRIAGDHDHARLRQDVLQLGDQIGFLANDPCQLQSIPPCLWQRRGPNSSRGKPHQSAKVRWGWIDGVASTATHDRERHARRTRRIPVPVSGCKLRSKPQQLSRTAPGASPTRSGAYSEIRRRFNPLSKEIPGEACGLARDSAPLRKQ